MPKYRVELDGRTFELEGDHAPTEAEARAAVGDHLSTPTAAPQPAAAQPKTDPFASARSIAGGAPASELWQEAKTHPVRTGAMIGSSLGTGAASPLVAIARAALGAAGGAGYGVASDAAQHGPSPSARDDLATVATEGAKGAASEAGGQMLSGALRMMGRGMYRAAALPINKFTKYGDLISEGLNNAVPVSASGLKQAEGLVADRGAAKAAALADADQRVMLRTKSVSADAGANLQGTASRIKRAGLSDPGARFDKQLAAFETNNPDYMLPSELEGVKSTLDNTVGGAYKKLRMREPLTPSEHYGVEMTQAQSRALEDVTPNYRDLNKDKMNAEGLRQMIARRVGPNGSGGNQGLENALTMLGGVHAIPARLAMLPPVLSRAAIAAHGVGASPVSPSAFRTALMALFEQGQEK